MRLRKAMAGLDAALIDAMIAKGRCVEVPAKVELLHEGGYVKELPVVLDGLVRVYIGHEEKELLLYHIRPAESCVIEFQCLAGALAEPDQCGHRTAFAPASGPGGRYRGWLGSIPLSLTSCSSCTMNGMRTCYVPWNKWHSAICDEIARPPASHGRSEWLGVVGCTPFQAGPGTRVEAREVITRTLKKLERDGRVEVGETGLRVR